MGNVRDTVDANWELQLSILRNHRMSCVRAGISQGISRRTARKEGLGAAGRQRCRQWPAVTSQEVKTITIPPGAPVVPDS